MLSSKTRLRLVVDGYLRTHIYDHQNTSNSGSKYESMLSLYIVDCLFIIDCFETYNKERISLEKEKKVCVFLDSRYSSCYGATQIPSLSQTIHHWKFKAHDGGIGIDESVCRWTSGRCFGNEITETKVYGIWYDGDRWSWNLGGKYSKSHAIKFEEDSIVDMIFNVKQRTLAYGIDNQPPKTVFENIEVGDDITYVMAVCNWCKGKVELLEYNEYLDLEPNKHT